MCHTTGWRTVLRTVSPRANTKESAFVTAMAAANAAIAAVTRLRSRSEMSVRALLSFMA